MLNTGDGNVKLDVFKLCMTTTAVVVPVVIYLWVGWCLVVVKVIKPLLGL